MTLSGFLAGLGPGLLATAMAVLAGVLVPQVARVLGPLDLWLVALQGVLVSIFGGVLRSARRKAAQRLAENLRLEQQILEISDDERRRIGHDLHDGLGQHLTGISLLSETMAQQISAGQAPGAGDIETITRLTSEAVGIARDLARSLSPVTLERDGLVAAMQELAGASTSLFGIDCVWECDCGDGEPPDLEHARALHIYRIVQEAVTNSFRHGRAKRVQIKLTSSGNDVLTVTVSDDGSGLSEKTTHRPGLGLRIMEYRAKMLGASLSVERASVSGGTIVTCSCPIAGPTQDGEKGQWS
jgi:signal transduction histidine kinase